MELTNLHDVDFPLACFLAHSDYDFKQEQGKISATKILRPLRALLLEDLYPEQKPIMDLMDFAATTMGSAMHAWLEIAINDPYSRKKALAALNMEALHDKIACNADPDAEFEKGTIFIDTEQREEKEIVPGVIMSGKFDLVINGQVYDLKTSSVWAKIYGNNVDKQIKQLSIYRWLNPHLIRNDIGIILHWYTDWSAGDAERRKNYPKFRCESSKLPLWSPQKTGIFLKTRIEQFQELQGKDQAMYPLCSQEELWQNNSTWSYYAGQRSKRASKNFENETLAIAHMKSKGNRGYLKERRSFAKACKYCSMRPVCNQAKDLENRGMLKL